MMQAAILYDNIHKARECIDIMVKNMEDKRVIKTKRNIKATLIRLLGQTRFENISVAELCRVGQISRITFYTYYSDKYKLADELFADYISEARAEYARLQSENNQNDLPIIGYINLLDCILDLYFHHPDFFTHAMPEDSPYLYSMFYRHIFTAAVDYIERHPSIHAKYGARPTAALLCNAIGGVIQEYSAAGLSGEPLRAQIKRIYYDLLRSDLFEK